MKPTTGSAASSTSHPRAPASSKAGGRSGARGSGNLVALGSAAVLAIYAAGYVRTKPAADRMAAESAASDRRRPMPVASDAAVASPVSDSAVTALQAPTVAADTAHSAGAQKAVAVAAAKDRPAKSVVADKDPVVKTAVDSGDHSHPSVPAGTASDATSAHPTAVASSASSVVQATSPPPATSEPPAVSATSTPAPPPKPTYVDGVYQGRGTSRHGDIEATLEIKDGRIASAVISQCLTRYSCSWVSHLLPQVVARQSAEVDYVSGATESANALYYAVLKALLQAK